MTIDQKQIEHLQNLTRLNLPDKEKKLYVKQLSSILDYVNKLQEVDIEGVAPCAHATEEGSVWREDVVQDCDKDEKKRILDNAPERADNLFRVKSVFE
ncbi:Asp-tRNA(Asn)/Glu-tRNA(Gln) amidotransferase subunit GatC [Patescibacteria group bacterium]|nr:Asp-tRNA(Asn)/Glu-tRNA(Gln) amidotransferase subunit GatC [Patescibacteria group bacterium]MBU1922255.1 Asp-tRNA(Asn)/Glu-tRNA(Gln) amidotransferase subunit GatC [Patescibacteria group bacterium]